MVRLLFHDLGGINTLHDIVKNAQKHEIWVRDSDTLFKQISTAEAPVSTWRFVINNAK